VWVRSVVRRGECTATLVLLRNQSAFEEVDPFLHGIELFTKLADCRIRSSNNGRAAFKPFSESARKSNNDHANCDGRDDGDDRESWLHRYGSCFNHS